VGCETCNVSGERVPARRSLVATSSSRGKAASSANLLSRKQMQAGFAALKAELIKWVFLLWTDAALTVIGLGLCARACRLSNVASLPSLVLTTRGPARPLICNPPDKPQGVE
jgi:hypothetical protein